MIIVSNWKAYVETPDKAKKLVAVARRLAAGEITLVLAPAAPHLGLFLPDARSKVHFAAQDLSDTTGGPQTGEVTAETLAKLGVTHVIVGHSERRARGESDQTIAQKVQHALAHGITPILCIGERERDEHAAYLSFVREELRAVLEPLSQKERMQVVVAYEPIWAIGKTAAEAITPDDLAGMVLYIRKVLGDYLPGTAPARIPVLYGGSVEAGNARDLAASTGIDGFLVGHASADPSAYAALVKAVS